MMRSAPSDIHTTSLAAGAAARTRYHSILSRVPRVHLSLKKIRQPFFRATSSKIADTHIHDLRFLTMRT